MKKSFSIFNFIHRPIIPTLWICYAMAFFLSTQKLARIQLGAFLLHPSYVFLGLLILGLFVRPQLLNLKSIQRPLFLCVIYFLIVIFSALVNGMFYDYPINYKTMVKWGMFFGTFLLCAGTLQDKAIIKSLAKTTVFSIATICLYGLFKVFFVKFGPVNPFDEIGTTQNALMDWAMGITVISLYVVSTSVSIYEKLFWALCLMAIICAQVMTFSRSALITVVLSLFLFFIFLSRNIKTFLGLLSLVFILYIGVQSTKGYDYIAMRMSTLSTLEKAEDASASRVKYGYKTMDMMGNSMLLGVGVNNFVNYKSQNSSYNIDGVSHNFYLNLLSDTGIVGAGVFIVAMLLFSFQALTALNRSRPHKNDSRLLRCLLLSIAIIFWRGITSHEAIFMPVTALLFGLTLSLIHQLNVDSDERAHA